ncbi:long-chain fatty acid transporter-like protein [Amniculicola lignicola CBS 123094]|uniref:Long-chain fatty acid transporter-like protein n=1 Tax=Amniculicola lignicola CBS 123094 TaxID=1392246 RepID=A0A6A5WMJ9_9PLEO|nr:long-chain fatty acid transporter-like protein [Amniculicola lignicola CBS 123094]
MALPILASLAGTTALAAYLNAKHHIAHDLRSGRGGLTPAQEDLEWLASRAARKRLGISHVLQEQAERQPSHPFLIFEGRVWTYLEFYERVVRVGNWLMKEVGVKAGEVVAIDGGNSAEYLMFWLGLDAVGAVISFVNWNLTGVGLVHCVKLCDSRFLITDEGVRYNVEPCRPELEEMGVKILYFNPASLATLSDDTPIPGDRWDNIPPESVRCLIYTSGTTGLPKGVNIGTARETLTGYKVAPYLGLKPHDRMYTCMPLYHGAAHGLCVTPSLHAGSTVVLGRKFSHKTFWPEVAKSGATHIQYVGELCRYLLNGPPNEYERKHCVKVAWGNGMRPDVWEPFRERFGIPIINELYAATDGLGATFNRNAGPFTAHTIGLRGALWHWRHGNDEVRVRMDVDTEDIMRDERGFAVRCKTGEPGQVLHRLSEETLASAPAYYNNTEATVGRRITDVFEKGDIWFKSGDMMKVDYHGRVSFVDRLGDTFRWKSENVSTNEVADMMGKFSQIAETNVYGVSIPGYDGRAGAASIVMADGVTESTLDLQALATHARAVLPSYAVPLFLRLTPALEYTGTLKVQKGRLKQEGVDPDRVTGSDTLYWLPPGSARYVPLERKDWKAIVDGSVRLT